MAKKVYTMGTTAELETTIEIQSVGKSKVVDPEFEAFNILGEEADHTKIVKNALSTAFGKWQTAEDANGNKFKWRAKTKLVELSTENQVDPVTPKAKKR